jgi:hypothetical protein
MTKVINTEKFATKFFTKSEIRYINTATAWYIVIPSMVPEGCTYKTINYTAKVVEITITTKEQMNALNKAMDKRVKSLRDKMKHIDVDAWCKECDERAAAAKKAKREEEAIGAQLKADGMWGVFSTLCALRLGENTGNLTACWSKWNGIACNEYYDRDNGYSKSCKFVMVRRDFTLNIRRGWHLFFIGGLLTFIKGDTIIRDGMPCEWVEQGKAIADLRTVKGYLVRGEHIEAKSLKEAKAINAEHRAMKLARLLSARKRAERRAEQKANGSLMVTFQDSLNAGNCRPGTMEFKHRYEEAIGHKADKISIADLRKYGKLFGVEYYAENAIQYALNH